MTTLAHLTVTPEGATLNGTLLSTASITGLYREFAGNYPKFFKMDPLCRLGFVAAEILLRFLTPEEKENGAVMLFNRNGSLITDRNYQQTIADPENYFPSPALFVYTLANIVTGEIAIRHKIYGETSMVVLPSPDAALMQRMAEDMFLTSSPAWVLTGWIDYDNEQSYLADLKLITK